MAFFPKSAPMSKEDITALSEDIKRVDLHETKGHKTEARMARSDPNQSDMTEALDHAKEYMSLLKEWISKRDATIREMEAIATELKHVKQSTNIAKVVGGTVAVVGGAGTVVTGGLAAPLVVGGIVGVVTVEVTSAGSKIAEKFISKGKLESAQKVLKEDEGLCKRIEEVKSKLDSNIRVLSRNQNLSFEQVQGSLLMATMIGGVFVHENALQLVEMLITSKILAKMLNTSFGMGSAIGKGMSTTLAEVSMTGAAKVAGRVLVGVMLVWDIYSLVSDSIELSKGSPSEAAQSLEKVALELAKQVNDLKDLVEAIRNQTEDFERKIREHFRKRLEGVSAQGYATDNDTQEIIDFMRTYSCQAWQQAFQSLNVNLNDFAFHIARVFRNIRQLIEGELTRRQPSQLTITLIAHGRIDPQTEVPCHIYYFNQFMEVITLYSPWGCAIDASVVYGIATNTMVPQNVQYSAPVHPGLPQTWNDLPKEFTRTPNIKFTPVLVGEGAHQALLELIAILGSQSDSLVIPYFTGMGNDLLPFPEIPLWVVANVVGICATYFNVPMKLRIAACLSPENQLNTDMNQYCLIPPAFMTNRLTVNQRLIVQLERIARNLPL